MSLVLWEVRARESWLRGTATFRTRFSCPIGWNSFIQHDHTWFRRVRAGTTGADARIAK